MRLRQVPAAARQAGELINRVPRGIHQGPALLLALLQHSAVAQQPTELDHSALQRQAFAALERCLNLRQQQACDEADPPLQALIRSAETPQQRLIAPRCLSGLTRVETHLNTVRWRLQSPAALQQMVEAAAADCPAPSAAVGQ